MDGIPAHPSPTRNRRLANARFEPDRVARAHLWATADATEALGRRIRATSGDTSLVPHVRPTRAGRARVVRVLRRRCALCAVQAPQGRQSEGMGRALGSRRTQLMPREGRGRDIRADAVGGRATEVPSGGQAECERSSSREASQARGGHSPGLRAVLGHVRVRASVPLGQTWATPEDLFTLLRILPVRQNGKGEPKG